MAGVNTQNKRRAAFNLSPFTIAPIPDGALGKADRRQISYIYRGEENIISVIIDIDAVLLASKSIIITLDAHLRKLNQAERAKINKRRSAWNTLPYVIPPYPDGNLDSFNDRKQMSYLYSGITGTYPITPGSISAYVDALLLSLFSKDIGIDSILLELDKSRNITLDAILTDLTTSSTWIKVFPIGYVGDNNAYSKGSFVEADVDIIDNVLKEPDSIIENRMIGHSAVSNTTTRPLRSRKIWDYRHNLAYNYDNIYQSDYKTIKEFGNRIGKQQNEDFYVIDFSQGQKVTGFAESGGDYNASISNTYSFSEDEYEGGNYVCVRNGENKEFRIGKITSIEDNSSITFSDSDDYGSLDSFTAHKTMAYPMYKVYLSEKQEKFQMIGQVNTYLEASIAGPIRRGSVNFRQKYIK